MINLYECRLRSLPSELRVHRFLMHSSALKLYTSCYEHNSMDSIIWDLIYCRRILQSTCGMSVDAAISNRCPYVMDAVHSASYIDVERPSRTGDFRLDESQQRAVIRDHLNRTGFDERTLNATLPDIFRYRGCLDDLEEISAACLPFATDACPKTRIRTAKIVRATMEPIRALLELVPDLRVILFVRDPRAVAFSRSSNAKPKNQILRNFLKLCMKMRADLYYKQQIEQTSPGSLILVRYEDFVARPMFWINAMYAHIGIEAPKEAAHKLIRTRLYAGSDDGLKFGNVRANASEIAYRWLPLIVPDLMFQMQRACPDVLKTLGYTFY
ncbi:hypothetical protein LSH36_292g00071 [Paralvinella palmiformis]|uniref:Sulfotransferase n=1 Tax=Paralvinella palmiformis TaxID=53620 RepID=A0AAD9N2Z8_9ANNE|nr:hypothetical protein LSH36_292g00071 [Paralvinella palmiformis]